MLGWLLLMRGSFEEARAPYQKAHDLQPEEFRWGFALGHIHLLAGDLPAARTCYQDAITLVRTEQEFQAALAVFDEFIEKNWQVEICQQELIWLKQEFEKEQLRRTEALYQQALKYDEAGDTQNAIDSYTHVIQRDPSRVEAYWNRGQLYSEQKKYDAAVADLRKVLELNPDLTKAYGELGWLLIMQGNFSEAKNFCYQAHQNDPTNLRWTMSLGHTFLLTGYPIMAHAYYREVVAQVKLEEEFTQAIATFEQLIENEMQRDDCQRESDWMKQEFAIRIETLFRQAEEAEVTENDAQALEYYSRVLALAPTHIDVYWKRGLLYKQQEQYDAAIADFQKIIELKPEFADAYGEFGWLLILQERFEDAKHICQKAHELDPKNLSWAMNLGHTYLLSGDWLTVRKYYENALPLVNSEEDYSAIIMTFEFFIEKDWQVDACRRELAWIKNEILYKLAVRHSEAKEYEDAIEYYTKVIELNPDYGDAYWKRGLLYLMLEKYESAAGDFRKAIVLKPDDYATFYCLGRSLLMQEKFEEANEVFHGAYELEPTSSPTALNLGHTYLFTEDTATARIYYQKGLPLTEEGLRAVQHDFELFIKKGWHVEACRQEMIWMEQTFTIRQQINTLYQEAEASYKAGEYDHAIESYTKVLEIDPAHFEAYLGRGLCYGDQENYDLAVADFRQMTVLKPDASRSYGILGLMLLLQNNAEEAQAAFQKASELAHEEAAIWTFNLGHTYLLRGDLKTAQDYYNDGLFSMKSREEFEVAILPLHVFIQKDWQAKACEQIWAWLEELLETGGYENFIIANGYWDHAKHAQEKGDYTGALGLYKWGIERFESGLDNDWSYEQAIASYQEYQMGVENFDWKSDEERGIAKPWQVKLANVLHQMGYCFLEREDIENAFAHYSLALELHRKLGRESEIAEGLKYLGMIHTISGEYSKAAECYEQALELFRKIDNDTEIAESFRLLGWLYHEQQQYPKTIEYCISALELFRKTGNDDKIAEVLNYIGLSYNDCGQNNKALEYLKQAYEINYRMRKEENIATNLNNIGLAYTGLGQYEKALKYYEQALELNRKLELEADIAIVLNNMGLAYDVKGHLEQALKYYEHALQLKQKLGEETDAILILQEISSIYETWGQHEKALEYSQRALNLAQQLKWDLGIARSLAGTGGIYLQVGQYDKAFEYFDQALEIDRKLGIEADIIANLGNIATVYSFWRKWDQALAYYEQALELARQLQRDDILAIVLSNFAGFYAHWKQYDKALEYWEQTLALNRKLSRFTEISRDLNNIAGIHLKWGRYEKSLEMYEQSLEIERTLGREAGIALLLNNIATIYREQAFYDKALELYQQALQINRKSENMSGIALVLMNIGDIYYFYLKQYVEAIPCFVETVEIIEKLRKTAPGEIRRDFFAGSILPYYALTLCYIHTGDFANAYQIYEQSRARWLAEQLAGYDTDLKIPSIEHIQTELAEDTAILVYVASTAVFVITRDEYTIVELPKDEFIQNIMVDFRQRIEDALKDVKNPSQIAIPRKEGEEFMTLELENTDFNKIVQYYRLLMKPKIDFRGSIIRFDNQDQGENIQKVLSTRFYQFFLGNLQEQIAGKTRLLIVPDGLLNFLPFETFMDEQDKYAAETYQISYIPSLSVLESIKERHYDPSRKPLLAFGGAAYNPQTYQGETIETREQFDALQRQADWLLNQGNSLNDLYGKLGYFTWNNLPGTLQEVVNIGNVMDESDIFTGKQVTESTVKELSTKGELADYKVLHFATHGIAVPELPELSALVLSQEEQEDGYLRIGEIAKLDIKADFVNLSACETGLGKINGGEGVWGLTQAFLVAGANGLSVSLWQVADDSTARFMVELYKLVKQESLSYANAITQVKRRFIAGEFGEQWKTPYYWAPFVYYGKN